MSNRHAKLKNRRDRQKAMSRAILLRSERSEAVRYFYAVQVGAAAGGETLRRVFGMRVMIDCGDGYSSPAEVFATEMVESSVRRWDAGKPNP